jgi:NAD(P)-dependent dehydrogenase (short-subunit alcohol dehydrogenase family)
MPNERRASSDLPKTVLVNGGSRGIGRATAIRAGDLGWSVAVGYRENHAAADTVVDAVEGTGGGAVATQGDVVAEADVVRMFDETECALGALDGVVINAGIVGPSLPLAEMSDARLRRMFEVNALGAFLCAREGARRLGRTGDGNGGSIVLVSSTAARLGAPGEYVDYAASKEAVDALCIGLSKELAADCVRVNAVRPGIVETELHASGGQPDRAQRLGGQAPLGRPGDPRRSPKRSFGCLSDAALYATGALLDVASGR